jgi:hypothetical protein
MKLITPLDLMPRLRILIYIYITLYACVACKRTTVPQVRFTSSSSVLVTATFISFSIPLLKSFPLLEVVWCGPIKENGVWRSDQLRKMIYRDLTNLGKWCMEI